MASWPIHRLVSDEALLQELDQRIARLSLERNLTQAQLAEQAGISKRTLEHLEAGAAATKLSLFLRVLRQLDLLKLQQSSRKRASCHRIAAVASTWSRGAEIRLTRFILRYSHTRSVGVGRIWGSLCV